MSDKAAETPTCGEKHCHAAVLREVKAHAAGEAEMREVAALFKVFGDGTRVRILYTLFEAELCVCDIAGLLGMTVSAVSHQLSVLKQARLVKFRREGKTVFYSLADDHVHTILGQGLDHIRE